MQTVTWLIELGVGAACVAIGVVAIRSERSRIVAAVSIVAGLAAAAHSTIELVG